MNTEHELKEVPTTFNDWREARRFRAWELHEKGWSQTRIAEALGVTCGAVSQWIKAVCEEGLGALLSSPGKRGPKPRLSKEELQQLPQFLERGAESYGFRGNVWTRARVGQVIKQEFGVVYSARQVGRLLQEIGWTRQKPMERADQRDEEEIADWCEETFPELKKKLIEKGERLSS
jgi:transposase